MPENNWTSSLEQIVGGDHLASDGSWLPGAPSLHERGWRGPLPKAVAFPSDREQVREILLLAGREKLTLAVLGNASRQRMGGPQSPLDLAVSLTRMNRVTQFPASDLTISVEPGIGIGPLRQALAAEKQMLPLDLPFSNASTLGGNVSGTIGGAVASNSNGPRRLGYGAWRDIVLGVEFVTTDGLFAKGGGHVVKNVAGYDIPKLLVGSCGTLAVIVELTLRTFPVPPESAAIALEYSSPGHALRAAQRIVQSQLQPLSLQCVEASHAGFATLPSLQPGKCHLVVEAAGQHTVVERIRKDLPQVAGGDGLGEVLFLAGEQADPLRDSLAEFTPRFLRAEPGGCVVKASLPLTTQEPFCEKASAIAEAAHLRIATIAQAATGIVHLHLWSPGASAGGNGQSDTDSAVRAAQELVALAEQSGGRGVIEWCPEQAKANANLWGTAGSDLAWMRAIKNEWDPAGILNPGKFYGGI